MEQWLRQDERACVTSTSNQYNFRVDSKRAWNNTVQAGRSQQQFTRGTLLETTVDSFYYLLVQIEFIQKLD